MRKLIRGICVIMSVVLGQQANAQNFDRSVNRVTLEAYLARAITMDGLTDMSWCPEQEFNWGPCKTPVSSPEKGAYDPVAYQQEIAMLARLNARFIGRAVSMWGGEYRLGNIISHLRLVVADINNAYDNLNKTRPIIQGSVFEIVTSNVIGLEIPDYVAREFGYQKAQNEPFNVDSMRYRNSALQTIWDNDSNRIAPDMSRIQTRMWFYYIATQYVKAGCEAIHFGQVKLMDRNDPGHKYWWDMLSRVRAYATVYAPRHLVLCDAHTPGEFYDPNPANPLSPLVPGQAGARQLLFDFHSYPLRIYPDKNKDWMPGGGGAYLDPNQCNPIYNNSFGGRTVLGWPDAESQNLPYLVEIDNFGNSSEDHTVATTWCTPWNYDEINWFRAQTTNYRNQWLKYAYYKVRCLDANGYLQMPGMKGTDYHASNGPAGMTMHYYQEDMIQRIWRGEYDKDWTFHDISQNIINSPPHTPNVAGNSVSIGENVYYIGTDGRIYTYNRNGYSWQTTSPTWVANATGINDQLDQNQVKAAGDLVASPDGMNLYYRGINGEIYGFQVIDPWRYRYFKLNTNNLLEPEKAASDLICAGNTKLYYRSRSNRIYAYVLHQGTWTPTSPSWVAAGTTPINNQITATGGLVVNPSLNRLYYRGSDNFIHGFSIDSDWDYHYFDLPQQNLTTAEQVRGSLVCVKDKQIFYVGFDNWVHGLVQDAPYGAPSSNMYGGSWGKVSPTYSAQLTPNGVHEQTQVASDLTASPSPGDNSTYLAYLGSDNNLHGYRILDDYNSEYFNFPTVDYIERPTGYVRFASNTKLFYVSNHPNDGYDEDGNYHYSPPTSKLNMLQLTAEPAACDNRIISFIEDPYVASRVASASTTQVVEQRNVAMVAPDAEVAAYPNPATSTLQVEVISHQFEATTAQLRDLYGKSIREVELRREGNAHVGTATMFVQDVAAGIYLLVVSDRQGSTKTSKVFIHH